jgi:hypothetical protein
MQVEKLIEVIKGIQVAGLTREKAQRSPKTVGDSQIHSQKRAQRSLMKLNN